MTPESKKMLNRPCFSPLAGDSEATRRRLQQITAEIDLSGGIEFLENKDAKSRKILREYGKEVQRLRFSDFRSQAKVSA